MSVYHRLGDVPRKRHTVMRGADGSLLAEELIGSHGFNGPSSLLYHLRPPTAVRAVGASRSTRPEPAPETPLMPRHFRTGALTTGPSPVLDRVPLLFNRDVALAMVRPSIEEDDFFRNGQADELIFVCEGRGVLECVLGELPFGPEDYLVVPRGIVHRFRLGPGPHRFLILESAGSIRVPRRYRNDVGQLTESSPYCERDLRRPERLHPVDRVGEFRILVKQRDALTEVVLDHHPFDVVGWDGCYYPWALNIRDFEPRVGRVHLPPPFHQTFEGDGFVVCSFCPRPCDFDRQAVPVPYHHSNVMSDEVLYYAGGEFLSRSGIERGSMTLHPDGVPHGPQPGRTEASLGRPATDEVALMLDTFRPLTVSRAALSLEDPHYAFSWKESP
jgi:homogentisate 1,2-dioxygenase